MASLEDLVFEEKKIQSRNSTLLIYFSDKKACETFSKTLKDAQWRASQWSNGYYLFLKLTSDISLDNLKDNPHIKRIIWKLEGE